MEGGMLIGIFDNKQKKKKVNKKVDLVIKHYDKVLGSIYKLLYSMCLKERISKKDLDNGLFDELPDRLIGGDLNK